MPWLQSRSGGGGGGGSGSHRSSNARSMTAPPPRDARDTSTNATIRTTISSSNTRTTAVSTAAVSTATSTTATTATGNAYDPVVVASLSNKNRPVPHHPYSSISLSPDRKYAIAASKDTLQLVAIQPSGLVCIKSIPIAPHFSSASSSSSLHVVSSSTRQNNQQADMMSLKGAFGFGGGGRAAGGSGGGGGNTTASTTSSGASSSHHEVTVVITDVAWSNNYHNLNHSSTADDPTAAATLGGGSSMIAAAGSNGVIVVWNADSLLQLATATNNGSSSTSTSPSTKKLLSSGTVSSAAIILPEAVLSQHIRAVNRLAWHPKLPLLLSASQDSTVLLWERRRLQQQPQQQPSTTGSSSTDETGTTVNASSLSSSSHHHQDNATPTSSSSEQQQQQQQHGGWWFGGGNSNKQASSRPPTSNNTASSNKRSLYSWHLKNRYEPKCEAVRDIQWSPFFDEVFALVTSSGSLIAYHRHVSARSLVKMTAHSGDAITLDWHPRRSYVVATGGARDRSVKVWDLEKYLNLDGVGGVGGGGGNNTINATSTSHNIAVNRDTLTSTGTEDSNETDRSSHSLTLGHTLSFRANSNTLNSSSRHGGKGSTAPKAMLHVLAISASVTRLRWRPPSRIPVIAPAAISNTSNADGGESTGSGAVVEDLHDAMMAVATAPIKGVNAGGAGVLALWSIYRPFVPLSVIQGHRDGAVTDFEWLETPQHYHHYHEQEEQNAASSFLMHSPVLTGTPPLIVSGVSSNSAGIVPSGSSHASAMFAAQESTAKRGGGGLSSTTATGATESSFLAGGEQSLFRSTGSRQAGSSHEVDAALFERLDSIDEDDTLWSIWQHVISVGRDGCCFVQSFVRGDRPIAKVPPSCFAMANLSPFQKGYGSLQLFSVCQKLPSDPASEFYLTGLRRDSITAAAPGMFREVPVDGKEERESSNSCFLSRFPESPPDLVFTVVDQGDLDSDSTPIEPGGAQPITVAPEVVHLSRFAAQYVLHPSDEYPTRVALCLHNSDVAARLRCSGLAHMWRMLASMLESSGMDGLPDASSCSCDFDTVNVMAFVILPAVHDLLIEHAEDGDVQTCVALCEVLQVVRPDQTVRVPDLDISLAREWYISYIDLLRDMCLFSHATFLIRNCNDPFIAALNQQSTMIHEACPRCLKPLLAEGILDESGGGTARRICKSCRRRVGFCFLCHEPVKGVYVWCPGCGHGGHLDHALQWFGGLNGNPVREVCPTGCGHRCNMLQQLLSFPRTESLKEFGAGDYCQVAFD